MTPKAESQTCSERDREPSSAARMSAGALGVALLFGGAIAQAQDSAAEQTPAPVKAATAEGLYEEEIVVVGSRLKTQQGAEGRAPVVVFNREKIDQLGVTTLADVLNYLPQQPLAVNEANSVGGSRAVRLRGLGLGTTLVLINGRRTVTSALQGTTNYFDLNTIPLSAVERVEVLSDSASAVYGADAVGGVLNVVLRNNVAAPFVDLYYGTAEGGAEETRGSLGYGQVSDRFRFSMAVDYFDRGELLGTEREYYNNQDYRRFGSVDRRAQTSNPGNISSRTAANLPGLTSTFAAVPGGSTGVGLTPASFSATAGTRNLFSVNQFSSIVPESTRVSGVVAGEFNFTDRLAAFGELLYSDRDETLYRQPASVTNAVVPATNPFNPFGVAVNATYLFSEIGAQFADFESETARGVLGVRGGLGSWDWEVSFLDISENGTTRNRNGINLAAVNAALASTDPNTALNLFSDGGAGNANVLSSIIAPAVDNDYSSDALQAQAFVRGALPFELPAGYIDMVVGAESRKENLYVENQALNIFVPADRDTNAGFAEMRVPLISGEMEIPAVNRLAITLAGRYDDYNDFGGTFNPQYGLEWQTIPSLLIRGTFGTSFRAPALYELYQPSTTAAGQTVDAKRGPGVVPITLTSGGNPNLMPEESESYTAGFVFQPGDVNGFKLSASYFHVDMDQRVRRLTTLDILGNEAQFANRVVRAAPTPADIAAGRPGALISIDTTSLNFGSLETSGVDLEISDTFTTPIGVFAPSLLTTYVDKFIVQDFLATPPVDRVGVASPSPLAGTVPDYRMAGTVAWSFKGIGLTTTVRYTPSYDDFNVITNQRNGFTVDSTTLVDLQASLNFGLLAPNVSLLEGFVVRAGVTNLLDETPPFSEVSTLGFDPAQGDLRQRFAYMFISKSF